ncbi:hypothetical protein ACSHWG_00925 [Leucobacter sp. Z1108]|uniref:hypothetical protein n=1 Tax=Leucobacter sp. Z1108 TaxID=3439066 RepID=UPI003F3D795C
MFGSTGFGAIPTVQRLRAGAGVGSIHTGTRIGTRTLAVKLAVLADSGEYVGYSVERLVEMLRTSPKWVVSYPDGDEWELSFVYKSGLEGAFSEHWLDLARYTIVCEAPQPYWSRRRPESFEARMVADVAIPFLDDVAVLPVSGAEIIADMVLTNPGVADSPVSWVVSGPASGDTVIRIRGRGFTILGPLAAGERIFVDASKPGVPAVTDQTGASRYDLVGPAPKFPKLPKGDSLVELSMEGAEAGVRAATSVVEAENHAINPRFHTDLSGVEFPAGGVWEHEPVTADYGRAAFVSDQQSIANVWGNSDSTWVETTSGELFYGGTHYKLNGFGDDFISGAGAGDVDDHAALVPHTFGGGLAGKSIKKIVPFGGVIGAFAVTDDGELWSWGLGTWVHGQATTAAHAIPQRILGSLDGRVVVDVSSGHDNAVAVTADGRVHTWGLGSSGALGVTGTTNRPLPAMLDNTGVLAGKTIVGAFVLPMGWPYSPSAATFLWASDGTLVSFGNNQLGVLGDGTTTNSATPILASAGALSGSLVREVVRPGRLGLYGAPDNAVAARTESGQVIRWGSWFDGVNFVTLPPTALSGGALSGRSVVELRGCDGSALVGLCSDGQVFTLGSPADGIAAPIEDEGWGSYIELSLTPTLVSLDAIGGRTVDRLMDSKNPGFISDDGAVFTWWGMHYAPRFLTGREWDTETPHFVEPVRVSIGALGSPRAVVWNVPPTGSHVSVGFEGSGDGQHSFIFFYVDDSLREVVYSTDLTIAGAEIPDGCNRIEAGVAFLGDQGHVSKPILTLTPLSTAYFDGESVWCGWTGVADESTAVRFVTELMGGSSITGSFQPLKEVVY